MSGETEVLAFDVDLPSGGLVYDGKVPGGRIRMSPMTTQDEKRMTSARDKESLTDDLVRKHIVESPIEYEKYLIGDKFFMLLFLRGITYGFEYEYTMKCQGCGLEHRNSIKVPDDFRIRKMTVDDVEPYVITLPLSKKEVSLRLLRVGDEIDVQRYVKRNIAKLGSDGDPAYIPRLARHIVSIDGKDVNGLESLSFVEKMYGSDSLAIRNCIDSHDCGADMIRHTTCPRCGNSTEDIIPIGSEFFRPKPSRVS